MTGAAVRGRHLDRQRRYQLYMRDPAQQRPRRDAAGRLQRLEGRREPGATPCACAGGGRPRARGRRRARPWSGARRRGRAWLPLVHRSKEQFEQTDLRWRRLPVLPLLGLFAGQARPAVRDDGHRHPDPHRDLRRLVGAGTPRSASRSRSPARAAPSTAPTATGCSSCTRQGRGARSGAGTPRPASTSRPTAATASPSSSSSTTSRARARARATRCRARASCSSPSSRCPAAPPRPAGGSPSSARCRRARRRSTARCGARTDGGRTWAPTGEALTVAKFGQKLCVLRRATNGDFYLGAGNGLFRSMNEGGSWTKVATLPAGACSRSTPRGPPARSGPASTGRALPLR